MASYSGYVEVVDVLLALPLDRKLDVNQVATKSCDCSMSGATPLWIASYRGNVEVVRSLLKDPRADPNIPSDRMGSTALMVAFDLTVVNTLLNCPKVDIDHEDKRGDTALDRALRMGDTDVQRAIESRFESGTDITQTC